MNKDYSIIIRTLGKAGDKYQRLLESIDRQTVRPASVKVYLPYGYDLPIERLGYEEFVYCKKGMVHQRAEAFLQLTTNYVLALDDDVEFDADFVEKLFRTMEKAEADFVSPIVSEVQSEANSTSVSSNKFSILGDIKNWLIGVAMAKAFKQPFLVKIWRTGGFLVKKNVRPNVQYFSQSGHGTCVFGKSEALKKLHFEDEYWLEDTKYALPDDMVMFYKLYLQGNVIAVNRDVRFLHLDAGSSLMNEDRKINNIFASARNGMIFWHRFVYSCKPFKLLSVLCFLRRMFFTSFFGLIKGVFSGNFNYFKTYWAGYKSAIKFIGSEKYKSLPKIETKC